MSDSVQVTGLADPGGLQWSHTYADGICLWVLLSDRKEGRQRISPSRMFISLGDGLMYRGFCTNSPIMSLGRAPRHHFA